jgi:hypothetical protein
MLGGATARAYNLLTVTPVGQHFGAETQRIPILGWLVSCRISPFLISSSVGSANFSHRNQQFGATARAYNLLKVTPVGQHFGAETQRIPILGWLVFCRISPFPISSSVGSANFSHRNQQFDVTAISSSTGSANAVLQPRISVSAISRCSNQTRRLPKICPLVSSGART